MSDETTQAVEKEPSSVESLEDLRGKVEKELLALLAHPFVPEEFKEMLGK